MLRRVLLIAAFTRPAHALLRVCTTLDSGFDMLVDPDLDPLQVTTDTQLKGFNVDMRREILKRRLNLTYEVAVYPSYGDLHVSVRKGECDVGWAAFFQTGPRLRCLYNDETCRDLPVSGTSVAPWRCCTEFSPPFLTYGVAILYDSTRISFFGALIFCITSSFFVNFISFLFLLVVGVSHLMWACERKSNSDMFSRNYLDGISNSVWWALVTITTVGYSDKVPITALGRSVGVVWLFIGLFLYSILTGHMADNFSAIRNQRLMIGDQAALAASGLRTCSFDWIFGDGEMLAAVHESKQVIGDSITACAARFVSGETDAIVQDSFTIKNWRASRVTRADMMISQDLNQYLVSIMYPHRDTVGGQAARVYRDLIDPAILDITQEPLHGVLQQRWAPDLADGQSGEDDEPFQWETIGGALSTLGLFGALQLINVATKRYKRMYGKTSSNEEAAARTTSKEEVAVRTTSFPVDLAAEPHEWVVAG